MFIKLLIFIALVLGFADLNRNLDRVATAIDKLREEIHVSQSLRASQ